MLFSLIFDWKMQNTWLLEKHYYSHLDTLQKHLTQANAFQNFFVQKFCFIEKQIALQKHVSIDQPYLESRMGFLLEKSLMPE